MFNLMFFSEIGPDFFGSLIRVFRPEDIVAFGITSVNAGVRGEGHVFKGEAMNVILIVAISFLGNELVFVGGFGDFDAAALVNGNDFGGNEEDVFFF